MGTRGSWGVIVDGTPKMQYVHWDAYPAGLGIAILRWLRSENLHTLPDRARALRVVPGESEATTQDIERLRQFADPNVGSRDLSEWYVLLRTTQGDPAKTFEAGVMEDGDEYGCGQFRYIADLDTQELRAYGSGGAQIAGRWPLGALPTDAQLIEAFVSGAQA